MKHLAFLQKMGLFFKISLMMVALLIISIGVTTVISVRKQAKIIKTELIEKNKTISLHLASSAKSAFWSLNWLFIETQMQEATHSEDVLFLEIVKPDGEVYLASGDKGCMNHIPASELMSPGTQIVKDAGSSASDEITALIITPIEIGKERWSLIMALSLNQIEEAKDAILKDTIWWASIIFVVSMVVSFLFARGIAGPIGQLAEGTKEIAKGNLDFRIKVRCHDQIGNLAESFNAMTDALKKTTTSRDSLAKEIIERKQAEEQRQSLEAQLQRARKMEAIGTLAGGVAHDLNNILSGLISYPELLLLDLPKESPLRDSILTIKKSGEKAAAIVQDLLTLARRGVAIKEAVNLNDIIAEYLRSPMYRQLKSFHPSVKIESHLDWNIMNVIGSPVHLSKTVMNLVSNAAESMPHGGTILVSTKSRYIDRPVHGYDRIEEGEYVALTVSDTGVGMSAEEIERIFEPFYTKKVMGRSGTGLGLAVVWGTVKDHNGYIDVQSTQAKGTAFTLYFPATRQDLKKQQSPRSMQEYMGKGESILVVDDVKEQREIASQMLKKLGYAVSAVSSGEEAAECLQRNSVDLLMVDMIMEPGIDGLETYRRVLQLNPRQKAIIVSGFSETDRVKEAQKLGAGAYVKKPYGLETIGLAVRAELDR